MADFVSDSFTGSAGTDLASHTGETGATWTKHGSYGSGSIVLTDANRVRSNASGNSLYYASGAPASADYDVASVMVFVTAFHNIGLVGRLATGADTHYLAWISGIGQIELYSAVAGSYTLLDSDAQTWSTGVNYTLKLELRGTSIKVFVDGIERCAATDSAVTAAGRAGVRSEETSDNASGPHFDSFTASNPAALGVARPPFARRTRFFQGR